MNLRYLNYGNFDTRTFSEIFPSDEDFEDFYNNCGLPKRLLTGDSYVNYGIKQIYAILVSEYSNSHIASYDENRFKFQVMSIIMDAGPAWQRAMAIQDRLLTMSDDDLHKGSKAVYNHAMHPDTEPGTSSNEELQFISDQNTAIWTKDYTKGLIELLYSLDDTLITRFVYRFKHLFQKIVIDDKPPMLFAMDE